MATQYLVVDYDRHRKVYINGDWNGWTNFTLELESGKHEVDLGDNLNYKPRRHKIDLRRTSVNDPMVISFVRKT